MVFPAGKHYPKVKDGASFSKALKSPRQRKIAEGDWNDIYEECYRKEPDVITSVGSAAGFLTCYLLGITNIDPIKYNLLFEHFLNPERVTMPDIDTDVAVSIRLILIAYLRWYFGNGAILWPIDLGNFGRCATLKDSS